MWCQKWDHVGLDQVVEEEGSDSELQVEIDFYFNPLSALIM